MRFSLLIIGLLVCCTVNAAKPPKWVASKPAMDGYYVGVGSARASDPNRDVKAKEKALADLVSEISIVIENSSLYNRLDENGKYTETYSNDIRTNSKAWLEGYELVETFNDGSNYWTLYRLDKALYPQLKKEKSAEASQSALSLWSKGNEAIKEGRLINAARLYAAGLKTIEPFADMRLEVVGEGTTMDLGVELYHSFTGLFSRLKIEPTPRKLTLAANDASSSDLIVRVLSGDHDLAGINLHASMKPASAKLSISGPTDLTGHATITISDVAPRPVHRSLTITPILDLQGLFDSPILKSLEPRIVQAIPSITVPVEVSSPGLKAYVVAANQESVRLANQISQFISKNYFDLTENSDDADIKIQVESSCRAGNTVDGTMYEMREYFSSATVTVTDLNSGKTVASVSIDNMRTLAPASASASKASTDAVRELSTRIKKSLNSRLTDAEFKRRTAPTTQESGVTKTDEYDFFTNEYE